MQSLAEDQLRLWYEGSEKIYKYRREFVPPEYVVYKKEAGASEQPDPTYRFIKEKSTYQLDDLSQESFIKKLCSEELVYERDVGWNADPKKLKTGGCDCGAWILKDNEALHDNRCPLYKGKYK